MNIYIITIRKSWLKYDFLLQQPSFQESCATIGQVKYSFKSLFLASMTYIHKTFPNYRKLSKLPLRMFESAPHTEQMWHICKFCNPWWKMVWELFPGSDLLFTYYFFLKQILSSFGKICFIHLASSSLIPWETARLRTDQANWPLLDGMGGMKVFHLLKVMTHNQVLCYIYSRNTYMTSFRIDTQYNFFFCFSVV